MLIKRLTIFFFYFVITILLALGTFYYNGELLKKALHTFITLSVAYLFFKVFLEALLSKKIRSARSRYSFRKTLHILLFVISFVIILRIWIVNPQALLVAYGLVAAGVAIALQDLFKNFAGGIVIFLTSPYQVGHRVEINEKYGDVIDIGMMYTTLLEMREWVNGDQTTGRISVVPNGVVLSGNVNNYTQDHDFIWDEFMLPITYESNWREAIDLLKKILKEETDQYLEDAQKNFSKLEEKYYVSKRNIEASVYLSLTDNWIQMNVRYIVEARSRRLVQASIMEKILAQIDQRSDIHIASTTLSLVDPSESTNNHG